MRLAVDLLDGNFGEDQRHGLYALVAETLAAQALALAAYRGLQIREGEERRWIEAVAGYPGVTARQHPDIGQEAAQRLRDLINAQAPT